MKDKLTLEQLLGHTFDAFQDVEDPAIHSQQKADFIFHMTDWIADLETLAELYKNPNLFEQKEARRFIFGFLVHVIPHLNAAGRLLLGEISDPFCQSEHQQQGKGVI
jgi:hypothetical protein